MAFEPQGMAAPTREQRRQQEIARLQNRRVKLAPQNQAEAPQSSASTAKSLAILNAASSLAGSRQPATTSTGESAAKGSLGGAATGAGLGFALGGAKGAAIGAVAGGTLGAVSGIFGAASRRRRARAEAEAQKFEALSAIEGQKAVRIQSALQDMRQAFSNALRVRSVSLGGR